MGRRTGIVAITATVAVAVLAGAPSAALAKKSSKWVGSYQGKTEEGGTVSFRVTKKRMVVGFRMPDVKVYCSIGQNGPVYNGAPFTITAPPMKLEGVARFAYDTLPATTSGLYQAGQWIVLNGKPNYRGHTFSAGKGQSASLRGNGHMERQNGSRFDPGTEICLTYDVDWYADKIVR